MFQLSRWDVGHQSKPSTVVYCMCNIHNVLWCIHAVLKYLEKWEPKYENKHRLNNSIVKYNNQLSHRFHPQLVSEAGWFFPACTRWKQSTTMTCRQTRESWSSSWWPAPEPTPKSCTSFWQYHQALVPLLKREMTPPPPGGHIRELQPCVQSFSLSSYANKYKTVFLYHLVKLLENLLKRRYFKCQISYQCQEV